MIASFTTEYNPTLPKILQPNELVNSDEYRQWNQDVQLKNNVNTGPYVWCHKDKIMTEDSESLNQKLSGLPNPKTLVQPTISIPIYDNNVWRSNDFMIPKGINSQTRQELWQNGYIIDDIVNHVIKENYNDHQKCTNSVVLENQNLYPNNAQQTFENTDNVHYTNNMATVNDRSFLTPYGYFPEQIQNNLPVNYPTGQCQKNPQLNEYNKNIFTTTLQPDVYSTSQVLQPDSYMSNLGISYTQPSLPTYSSLDKNGVIFTQYDPEYSKQFCHTNPTVVQNTPENDIYDPRFTGYGTSYRSYVDDLTGQPRFYYDDVDEFRRSKFITRNYIDFTPFGLQTGPQYTKPAYTNMEIRELANNTFLDNSLSFRTDLQQRLMTKATNRAWQQKQAPIITNQYTKGASSGSRGVSSGYIGPRG